MAYRPGRIFWAILTLAVALRLSAAAFSDFYVDEAFSYFLERSSLGGLLAACRVDAHPPLFYLLSAPLAQLTREPLLLRLPGILLAAGSLWLLAQLTFRAAGRPAVAWVCLLQATVYLVWNTETTFRSNALFEFLNLAVLWAVLEIRSGNPLPRGVFEVASLLLPLSNLLGNLTSLGALLALRSRRSLWPLAGTLLSLIWLAYSLVGGSSALREARFGTSALGPLEAPGALLSLGLPLSWSALRGVDASWIHGLGLLIGWSLLVLGLVRLIRQDDAGRWIALALVVPLVALVLLSWWRGGGWAQVRYFVPYSGLFFVVWVRGLPTTARWLLTPTIVIGLVTAAMFPGDTYFWNQNWAPFARFVASQWREGDFLLAYHPYNLLGFDFLYNRGQVNVKFHGAQLEVIQPDGPLWLDQMPVVPELLTPDLSRRLGSSRVFLLLNQENDDRVRRWFAAHYQIVAGINQHSVNSWGNCECYLLVPN